MASAACIWSRALLPCAPSHCRPRLQPSLPKPSVKTSSARLQKDTESKPPVFCRSLQLGLVLVNTVHVAGALQAGAVAAVGAVDQVLSNNDVSETKNMGRTCQEAAERCRCRISISTSHPWVGVAQIWSNDAAGGPEIREGGREGPGVYSPCIRCSCSSRYSPVAIVSKARSRGFARLAATHRAVVHVAAVVQTVASIAW